MWIRDPGQRSSPSEGRGWSHGWVGSLVPRPRVYRDRVYSTQEGHPPQACLPVSGRNEALRRRLEVFLKEPEGPDWKQNGLLLECSPLLTPGEETEKEPAQPEVPQQAPPTPGGFGPCSSPYFCPLKVSLSPLTSTDQPLRPQTKPACCSGSEDGSGGVSLSLSPLCV